MTKKILDNSECLLVHLLGVVIVILTIKYVHLDRLVGGRIGLTRVVTRVSNRDPVDGESGDELSARGVGESLQGTSEAVVMGRRRARSEELRKRKEKKREEMIRDIHCIGRIEQQKKKLQTGIESLIHCILYLMTIWH